MRNTAATELSLVTMVDDSKEISLIAAAAIGFEQAELLEPRADADAADVQVAGDGGDGGLFCPGRDEVVVFEGTRRPAAAAEAPGGELAGPGLVVELAEGAKGTEVLADRACRDAELGGQLALRERTAAALTYPVCQQLQGVDGGRRAAPATA